MSLLCIILCRRQAATTLIVLKPACQKTTIRSRVVVSRGAVETEDHRRKEEVLRSLGCQTRCESDRVIKERRGGAREATKFLRRISGSFFDIVVRMR